MLRKLFVLTILLLLVINSPALAQDKPMVEQNKIEAKTLDKRAQILQAYLSKFNSPLQYHTQDFIDAADFYGMDWKLVPAISGVESTFGKAIPGGYNAWGWGVYGTQAIYFNSWRHGIFTVSKGLKENYINKGLTNPYAMNRIYATSPTWGSKVAYFLGDIEQFSNTYNEKTISEANLVSFLRPTAAPTSYQLEPTITPSWLKLN